jgi:hypothetical protein
MHPLTTFLLTLLVPGIAGNAPGSAPGDAQVPLAEVRHAEAFLRERPDTPLTAYAYLWIQHRQRAAFELETDTEARVRAARKYQTFLKRARASSVAMVVSLAEAIDAQPFVCRDVAGHPRDVLPAG